MKKRELFLHEELNSDIEDIISEATDFIGDSYGMPDGIICRISGVFFKFYNNNNNYYKNV